LRTASELYTIKLNTVNRFIQGYPPVGAKKAATSAGARADAASTAIQAVRLLGRWTRIAQGHLVFGSGCSCGPGFGTLRMQDFEQHILDFLHSRHGTEVAVAALLRQRAGFVAGEAGSFADLLRAIAARRAEVPAKMQSALLADIERIIESFEEQHPGMRAL
jgi:hypothetical protein